MKKWLFFQVDRHLMQKVFILLQIVVFLFLLKSYSIAFSYFSIAGIVGGTLDLNKINTYSHIWEEQGNEPRHKLGLTLGALELRLDYMGNVLIDLLNYESNKFYNIGINNFSIRYKRSHDTH